MTLLSSAFARDMLDRKFAVIDPLCGRGTALNQALLRGFDAAGLDIDQKGFEAYSAFPDHESPGRPPHLPAARRRAELG